ncbi:unnamed protein product [Cyprideis torosa]|uniref:Ubiquitin thioesterase OTU n=1 Tax=Cyprideis torosa TaxID=163714 RepID=A0A7R8W8U8_9CRUS|nr:unnamed protein product [Cyprideis torosa]CAG0888977.1 unnamed protein product [Cyprideis torosa]
MCRPGQALKLPPPAIKLHLIPNINLFLFYDLPGPFFEEFVDIADPGHVEILLSGIMYNFKVKANHGTWTLNGLSSDITLGELKQEISKLTGLNAETLSILRGFPPKEVDVDSDPSVGLSAHGFSKNDSLIIRGGESPRVAEEMTSGAKKAGSSSGPKTSNLVSPGNLNGNREPAPGNGLLMRKTVPADNSCLFTSINFLLTGEHSKSSAMPMRRYVAQYIKDNPERFPEVFLGRPPNEYIAWIQKEESWGGGIEISIFSEFYGYEIVVVDTQSGCLSRFGEDKEYSMRMLLIFDGIHYDPLFWEYHPSGSGGIQTAFPTSSSFILNQAEAMAQEAKRAHQFTDVNRFTIKCLTCGTLLLGQTAAQVNVVSFANKLSKVATLRIRPDAMLVILLERGVTGSPSLWVEIPKAPFFAQFDMDGVSAERNEIYLEFCPARLQQIFAPFRSNSGAAKVVKIKLTKKHTPCLTFEIDLPSLTTLTRKVIHDVPVSVIPRRMWSDYVLDQREPDLSVYLPNLRLFRAVAEKVKHLSAQATLSFQGQGHGSVLSLLAETHVVSVATHFKDTHVIKDLPMSRTRSNDEGDDNVEASVSCRFEIKKLVQFLGNDLPMSAKIQCDILNGKQIHLKYIMDEVTMEYFIPGMSS